MSIQISKFNPLTRTVTFHVLYFIYKIFAILIITITVFLLFPDKQWDWLGSLETSTAGAFGFATLFRIQSCLEDSPVANMIGTLFKTEAS